MTLNSVLLTPYSYSVEAGSPSWKDSLPHSEIHVHVDNMMFAWFKRNPNGSTLSVPDQW